MTKSKLKLVQAAEAIVRAERSEAADAAEILRLSQTQLGVRRKAIERELEELRRERPESRREITQKDYERAQKRSNEIAQALGRAGGLVREHQGKLSIAMDLALVPEWTLEFHRLANEALVYGDLWKLAETYAERCRQLAEDARGEPDLRVLQIFRRIDTLKDEFDRLGWNAAASARGLEILDELKMLHRELNRLRGFGFSEVEMSEEERVA